MKLFEAFLANRRGRGRQPAFLIASGDRSIPITWRQFTDDIATVAHAIEMVNPTATVAVLGENSYEWMVVHAACLFSKATALPLDANLTADEIVMRLQQVGASILTHSSLYVEKARETAAKMPGLSIHGFGTRSTDEILRKSYDDLAAGAKTIWDGPAPDRERTAMIVFTSGTTADPRGVELTIHGIEVFGTSADVLKMKAGNRSLMLLPLHHIFGVCTTYLMLASGVALGVCPDFRRVYDAVERFRANFLFLVPALAEILASRIDQHGRSAEEALGSPIDWILTGGAALPRRVYEHLTSLGVKTLTGYGLTETTALYSIAPLDEDPHVGSAGKVTQCPEVETAVSPTGELLIKGPCILRRYYNNPEKTAAVIDADGWYHTGDLGTIDADGFVWITGRASRTIILSSGKKVAPEELEERLLAIPGIREAVVSGNTLTRDIIAEVFASIPEATVRRSIDALNMLLPTYKRINTVKVRTEPFPRTSSGKIRVG